MYDTSFKCPTCGRFLPYVNFNPQIERAICAYCHDIIPCEEEEPFKGKFLPPETVRIDETPDKLSITLRQMVRTDPVSVLGCLVMVWILFLVPISLFIMFSGISLMQTLSLIAASVLLCVAIPASLLLRQKDRAYRTSITPYRFIPAGTNRCYYETIRAVYVRYVPSVKIDECSLWVISDGDEFELFKRLTEDEAYYIARAIKRFVTTHGMADSYQHQPDIMLSLRKKGS
jgi:hypothetical protein